MKGQFSIEWLSQSSSSVRDEQQTSSTSTDSLPGSYSRWTSPHMEKHMEEKYTEEKYLQEKSMEKFMHEKYTEEKHMPEKYTEGKRIQKHTHESGFSSSTEDEELSGCESEGSRSEGSGSRSPAAPGSVAPASGSGSPSSGRRPRTAFSSEQISSLERVFKRNAYLGAQDKAELCRTLKLTDKQIRNWFQNRRMKLKRTVQDSLAQACQVKVASHMMHYSDLHSFRAAPYPSFYPETPAAFAPPYPISPAAESLYYSSYQNLQGVPSIPVHPYQYYSTH
ncbi:ventrally expressed dharma/bozozok antagonist [Danio rerio]|uniref:Homeobox protein Ved n=1 Tax=Danio rerio TaxID=7955 RepID=Q8AV71_DANRE|nr:ventrally expressed dharma/bozozok antagonist [Danio rerio]AAI62293.1 Ventrally expressed dharma/bozozok antagonist [Danio rerio]AAI62308.1 Ventrally expressed dharma/bozozok antagonist [Danio rerio]BAC16762.1 homeobox protein Ved [Danio rerio]|eukprot:NP_898897.1 ventrally expressed dharma/bozozok antagonist [Danio rerio]